MKTNYRMALWFRQLPMVSRLVRLAISQGRRLGSTMYPRAIELATNAALHGALFLISGDVTAGSSCYAYLAHLEMANLGELAWLAGTLATLIAASVGMNAKQGHLSGEALQRALGQDARVELVGVWRVENPRQNRKAA